MLKSLATAVRKISSLFGNDEDANANLGDRLEQGRTLHATDLRHSLGSCPACKSNFVNHYYSTFALTICTEDTKQRMTEFFTTVREHRWQDAMGYQEFDGSLDAIAATAIQCPNRTITVVLERDPTEYYENRSLLDFEVLTPEDSEELKSLIKDEQWYPL